MDKYIGATVEVVQRTFEMMFQLGVRLSDHRQEESQVPPFAVSGVIGITGPTTGCVVISFPEDLAREMAARTFSSDANGSVSDDDIYDCVGEVANVVGGNLLPMLEKGTGEHRISLPSVVVGEHRVVWRRKDTPYDLVFFETELGRFGAGINLRQEEEEAVESNAAYRILLVDDSRLTRRLVRKAVDEAGLGECQFIEAPDGQAALKELEQIGYAVDAIFCDLYMPNLDGIGFLDTMASRGKLAGCPVIMVTGDASEGRGEQAVAHGARECLGKPFTPQSVRDALRRALGLG